MIGNVCGARLHVALGLDGWKPTGQLLPHESAGVVCRWWKDSEMVIKPTDSPTRAMQEHVCKLCGCHYSVEVEHGE